MATAKTAISLEETLFQQVDDVAQKMKVPRSRVFTLALEDFLRRQRNQQLLDRINEAYEDLPDPDEQARLQSMRREQKRLLKDTW